MAQKNILLPLCLLLLVALAHGDVIYNDYVLYDDYLYVYDNTHVRDGLTPEGVGWAFRAFNEGNWHPLTWLSHMTVVEFRGLDPAWHHLLNLLLHAANVLLLFGLLCSMTHAPVRGFAVAALFAAHPLHVESVAWIAERKDVLSMFFGLLALQAYVLYAKKGGKGWYVGALALLLLGLMCKPLLVSLPLLLLLLDCWPLDRVRWSSPGRFVRENKVLFLEKIPFVLVVVGAAILAMLAQQHTGAMADVESFGVGKRLANALTSYVAYLWKLVAPLDLAPLYPLRKSIPLWKTFGALVLLVGISGGVFFFARRARYLAVGWVWYLVAMLPMIGIVQVGVQSMADRYAYLPFVGLYVALVWGVGDLLQKISNVSWRKLAAVALLVVPLVCLTLLTRHQVALWQSTFTLFQHAVDVVQDNYKARRILAKAYAKAGEPENALAEYRSVLAMRPEDPISHWHVIKESANMGQYDAATAAMATALEKFPKDAKLRNLNGFLLYKLGRLQQARDEFARAVELNPNYEEARRNLENITRLLEKRQSATPGAPSNEEKQEPGN